MTGGATTWLRAALLGLLLAAGAVVMAPVDLPAVDSAREWLDRSGPVAATDRFLGARGFGTVLTLRLFPAAPFTAVAVVLLSVAGGAAPWWRRRA